MWTSVADSSGLSTCGSQAIEHRHNSCAARLTCSMACGIFLDQGSNPISSSGRQVLYHWATREARIFVIIFLNIHLLIYFWLCWVLVVACRIVTAVCELLSSYMVHRLQSVWLSNSRLCPMACGILVPQPGIKPPCAALEGRFLNIGSPGKSLIFFTHASSYGHLCCFQFGTSVNKTTKNIWEQIFVWTYVFISFG